MFGRKKARETEVLNHWYSLVPGFKASTREFYATIETELKERKVPGLDISRVEFSEGGLFSDKREYLRMTRERLVFDICAAPFGTSYFFSCRFSEIPTIIRIWQIAILCIAFGIVIVLALKLAGLVFGALLLFAGFAFVLFILRNNVAMGLRDLDSQFMKSPLFGPIYERFFRKETYYREDTRLMYLDTVNEVVKETVEEFTGAKGIKLVRFNEYSPILGELYKPTIIVTRQKSGDQDVQA